jgi:hypothetical protein
MFGFLHYFIDWLGRETGYGPWIGQPACCGLCREPFFLGAVTLSNSVDGSWKVAMYGDGSQKVYVGRTWTGVGSVHVMLVGFPPVGCTSIRIAVTVGYE